MYLFKKAMLKYRLLIISFVKKRLHFFLPFGMFIVTRNLGKFKVKKLDGGNLKAGDDQLEDVVYNDDYGDVDDDFTKRRRSN